MLYNLNVSTVFRGDIMRICDICFGELTEEGTYEIENGIRKDYCTKCLEIINTKLTDTNGEILIKKHIDLMDKKDENIESLISKVKKESRNRSYGQFVTEQLQSLTTSDIIK